MKTIAASKFRQQCLAIMDRLDAEGIVITKRGRPVARLLPIDRTSAELIGCLNGQIRVKGDILSTGLDWHTAARS
jgi:prevent-host-death family protein